MHARSFAGTSIDRVCLKRELRHWAILTALCALPSFVLALMGGFGTPAELVAMVCGVFLYALFFAYVSSLNVLRSSRRERSLIEAMRRAARLKIAWAACGFIAGLLAVGVHFPTRLPFRNIEFVVLLPLMSGIWVDMLTGSTIVNELGLVRQRGDPFTAYAATLLATLLQGAAIAAEIGVLGFVVSLVQRRRPKARQFRQK